MQLLLTNILFIVQLSALLPFFGFASLTKNGIFEVNHYLQKKRCLLLINYIYRMLQKKYIIIREQWSRER